MIPVTTMNGEQMYVNEDLIETMRVTPDTVLFMKNGKRLVVQESAEEVCERIRQFRRETFAGNLYIEMKAPLGDGE